jgi:hypothetical protein
MLASGGDLGSGRAAALVLLLVAVLLGGGLLYIRRDSASVGPVASGPTATTSLPVRATATTTAPATATAAPTVAAVPTPVVAPTRVPTPLTVAASATPRATVLLSVTLVPAPPWWQRSEDTPPALVQPLVDGYLRFWEVRAQALLTLQSAPLNGVMSGEPLRDELAAIERLRSANQAQRVEVGHSITVLWATTERGAVLDDLADRTTVVPLGASPPPSPSPPAKPYRMAYLLQRTSNGWQVVDSVRITR